MPYYERALTPQQQIKRQNDQTALTLTCALCVFALIFVAAIVPVSMSSAPAPPPTPPFLPPAPPGAPPAPPPSPVVPLDNVTCAGVASETYCRAFAASTIGTNGTYVDNRRANSTSATAGYCVFCTADFSVSLYDVPAFGTHADDFCDAIYEQASCLCVCEPPHS